MKTLSVFISEIEFNKFGLTNNEISFSELLEIISNEFHKINLRKSIQLAQKYNLSKLSNEEINEEIKAIRNAKNNN